MTAEAGGAFFNEGDVCSREEDGAGKVELCASTEGDSFGLGVIFEVGEPGGGLLLIEDNRARDDDGLGKEVELCVDASLFPRADFPSFTDDARDDGFESCGDREDFGEGRDRTVRGDDVGCNELFLVAE